MGKIFGLAVLFAIFVPIERLRPRRAAQRIFRPGFFTDVLHFTFNEVIAKVLILIPFVLVVGLLTPFVGDGLVREWPTWAQAILAIVVVDFTGYWSHRLFHGKRLWRFHRIHHSSENLDWLASVRRHPLNEVIGKVINIVPLVLLGVEKGVLGGAVGLLLLWALFLHSNVDLRLRWLRFVVATPMFHHWHHSSDDDGRDKNFAGLLPVWDLLFGTFHCPDRWPDAYGADRPVPVGWFGQMIDPIKRS